MSEKYPKEVLDALRRDGITFNEGGGRSGKDERLAYGATCTWFGPIAEAGIEGKLPCCPHCRRVLFEMPTEAEWWAGVDRYESDGHPGYRALLQWQRDQKKCFKSISELWAAYDAREARR